MISFLLSLVLLLGGGPGSSQMMCSCARGESLDHQIADADLIFEGVAIETHNYPRKQLKDSGIESDPTATFGMSEYVFFYAVEVWKGSQSRDLLVSTPDPQKSTCGYHFEKGRRYLVYAYVEGSQPVTNICTLTKPSSEAGKDREKLNATFEN